MEAESKRRISITKTQRNTAAGIELISLCQTMTDDGTLSVEEVNALRQWLIDNKDTDLPANEFLSETVGKILADGVVTPKETNELYAAIEKVLPPDVRELTRGKRKAAEASAREARKAEITHQQRNIPIDTWDFMVAGCQFEGRPPIIQRFAHAGESAYLVRDPGNQHSCNAVEVRLANGMQVGWVSERLAVEIAPLLDEGHPHEAHIKKILTGGRCPIPVIVAAIYPVLADLPSLCTPSQVPAKAMPPPITSAPATSKICYCRACGTQLMQGAAYCSKCGLALRDMATPSPAPRPALPAAQARKGSGCLVSVAMLVVLLFGVCAGVFIY